MIIYLLTVIPTEKSISRAWIQEVFHQESSHNQWH